MIMLMRYVTEIAPVQYSSSKKINLVIKVLRDPRKLLQSESTSLILSGNKLHNSEISGSF